MLVKEQKEVFQSRSYIYLPKVMMKRSHLHNNLSCRLVFSTKLFEANLQRYNIILLNVYTRTNMYFSFLDSKRSLLIPLIF